MATDILYTPLSLLKNVTESLYNRWHSDPNGLGLAPFGLVEYNFWLNYLYNEDGAGYFFYELKLICLLYAGIDIQNNVLNSTQHSNLSAFLLSQLNFNNSNNGLLLPLRLLYRGSETIFDCDIFKKVCRNKRNILVLLRNKYDNVLFGGYSSIGIKGIGEHIPMISYIKPGSFYFIPDETAFLYRWQLQKKNMKFPEIFKMRKKTEWMAINRFMLDTTKMCDLCHFGLDDLYLTRWKQSNILRARSAPDAYEFQSGKQLCGQVTPHVIQDGGRVCYIDIDMIEIYQLKE
eukprot:UN01703